MTEYITGKIIYISDLEQIRRPKMTDIFKKYIGVEIKETKERVFLEIRNSGLKLIDRLKLDVGVEIEFKYEFQGVFYKTRNDETKFHNNILITQIKLIEDGKL